MSPICLALIQGGVGFAIGAGTNDLAIRWIFHTVFAKKKREIAQAVQRVVSSELMTPEKVAAYARSPFNCVGPYGCPRKELWATIRYRTGALVLTLLA